MAGTPLPELATQEICSQWGLVLCRSPSLWPFLGTSRLLDESSLLLVWNSCFKCVFKLFQVSTLLIPQFHVVVGVSPLSKEVSLPNRSLATVSQDLRGNNERGSSSCDKLRPDCATPPPFLSSLWHGLELDNYTLHPGTHASIHYWLRSSPPPPQWFSLNLITGVRNKMDVRVSPWEPQFQWKTANDL